MVSLSVLAAVQAVYAPEGTNKVGLAFGVVALYGVVIFYCLGVEACGSIFYSEIFPTHIRAKGVCFTTFINSLSNLVILMAAPTALQNIGWKFILVSGTSFRSYQVNTNSWCRQVFVAILAVGCVAFWVCIPETKSVPLEELAAIFGDADEVKVFSADIHMNSNKEIAFDDHHHSKAEATNISKEPAVSEHEESLSTKV